MTISSGSPGMARNTLAASDRPSSVPPPMYPAAMPTITASSVATRPAMKPTTMVARAPFSSWEKMSAPRLLVPSQCVAEGCRFGANAL